MIYIDLIHTNSILQVQFQWSQRVEKTIGVYYLTTKFFRNPLNSRYFYGKQGKRREDVTQTVEITKLPLIKGKQGHWNVVLPNT